MYGVTKIPSYRNIKIFRQIKMIIGNSIGRSGDEWCGKERNTRK